MNDTKRLNTLIRALDLDSDSELVKTVVQNICNITIREIDQRGNEYEVFADPHSITGKELENLQELFEVKEIGIYGDPNLPEDEVYFHMILELE